MWPWLLGGGVEEGTGALELGSWVDVGVGAGVEISIGEEVGTTGGSSVLVGAGAGSTPAVTVTKTVSTIHSTLVARWRLPRK